MDTRSKVTTIIGCIIAAVLVAAAAIMVTGQGYGEPPYSSCAEAEAAGKAPLHRGDPGYIAELDRDGDGVACDQ